MTRLVTPPGASLPQATRRMRSSNYGLPVLLSDGTDASSNRPTITATAHATPHTVGNWAEVVAALSADVGWVQVTPAGTTLSSGANSSTLLNVGVGAGGSEQTVIDGIGVGWFNAAVSAQHPGWMFPLFIPKGSRVAVQIQSAITLQAAAVRLDFFAPTHGIIPSRKVLSMGVDLAGSKGVTLATPGGANAESAWTQITAATAEPYGALGVSIQGGADVTQAATTTLVDVAIGSAGNEVPIISDLLVVTSGSEFLNPASPLVHPVNVPRGSRLSARWQGAAVTGGLDVALHGVRRPL